MGELGWGGFELSNMVSGLTGGHCKKQLPSQADLRELLEYDPETGALCWKDRCRRWFNDERSYRSWKGKNLSGSPALSCLNSHGHRQGWVAGQHVAAHRVIWKWMTGVEPEIIDHINGNGSDNRWVNLRNTTHSVNLKNSRRYTSNTSGRTGVWRNKRTLRWNAEIKVEGVKHHLGCFPKFEDAAAARADAEKRYGFHPNHGRAA